MNKNKSNEPILQHTLLEKILSTILNKLGYSYGILYTVKTSTSESYRYISYKYKYITPVELSDLIENDKYEFVVDKENYIITNVVYMGLFKKVTK